MYKEVFLAFFITLAVLFLIPEASANFVCGKAISQEGIDSTWANVIVSYTSQPAKNTTCKVSPDQQKYCCDPLSITGVSWGVGKQMQAFISEKNGIYFTQKVYLNTSGHGYDIFDDLYLKQAININSPNTSIIQTKSIFTNISLESPYNILKYILENESGVIHNKTLCSNCSDFSFNISNLDYGNYIITFFASDGINEVFVKKNISIISNLSFSRQFICEGCKGKTMPADTIVNVVVRANLSHPSIGKFIDYYPLDWQFLSNEQHGDYSESHGYVSFDVSGTHIERNYTLRSPVSLLSKRYTFQSQLESFFGKEDKIVLSKFLLLNFMPFPEGFNIHPHKPFYFTRYFEVTKETPLILNINLSSFSIIAIYPTDRFFDAQAFIQKQTFPKMSRASESFTLISNINDIDKIVIFASFSKDVLKKKEPYLYFYDGKWIEVKREKISEDENKIDYKFYANKTGGFALKYQKK